MNIPFVDLHRNYQRISDRIDGGLEDVIDSTMFIGGEKVEEFERQFAEYVGVEHGIGVASGTDAITLGIEAAGIAPGDEVITVSHTFISTVDGIVHNDARPRFVDVDPGTYNIDPSEVENAITEDTEAIMAVHLYGQPVDLDPLVKIAEDNDLLLLEDASQAHGAEYDGQRVGSVGDIAFFSFYPSKNLGAFGDAGFVATDDSEIAERVSMLREYGEAERYDHQLIGYNSRLDTMQAAVLQAKLPELDIWNAERREAAAQYDDLLADLPVVTPKCRPDVSHVYHLYVIQVQNKEERNALQEFLEECGVSTGIHYPVPIHQQQSYQDLEWEFSDLPQTEEIADRILSLPIFPEITDREITYVADRVREFYEPEI